jgi:hypothetical protein
MGASLDGCHSAPNISWQLAVNLNNYNLEDIKTEDSEANCSCIIKLYINAF